VTPKLSILIITIPSRAEKLQRLLDVLRPQLPTNQSVEVIIKEELPANDGGPTVGANRNAAVADASGDYVCFIDDDDMVSEHYIKCFLEAIKTNPDVVELRGDYTLGNNPPERFIHSIRFSEWKTVDGVHQRTPNHLNCVKRSLALQVPFPEKNYGEDFDYSLALRPLLKTEAELTEVIYLYLK